MNAALSCGNTPALQVDVDASGLQGADGLDGRRLDAVGNGDDGQGFRLVGKPYDGLRLCFPSQGGFLQGGGDAAALHQAAVARIIGNAFIDALYALSRHALEFVHFF